MSTDPRIQCTYDGIKAIRRRLIYFRDSADKVDDPMELMRYWVEFKKTISMDIMEVPIICIEVESTDQLVESICL